MAKNKDTGRKLRKDFERKTLRRFVVVSLAAHLFVGWAIYKKSASFLSHSQKNMSPNTDSAVAAAPMNAKIYSQDELNKILLQSQKKNQLHEQNESKKIVETKKARPDEVNADSGQVTQFLGERRQRVKKETRALGFGSVSGEAQETREPLDAESSAAKSANNLRNGSEGNSAKKNLQDLGLNPWSLARQARDGDRLASPASSGESTKLNSSKARLAKGSLDNLGRDIAVGSETILNTDEYKYSSFFNRLKEEVAPRWQPSVRRLWEEGDAKISPGFYKTETLFVMNDEGKIIDAQVIKPSGYKPFDDEAVAALRKLAEMQNLPRELREADGLYRIRLGFLIDLRSLSSNVLDYEPDPRLRRAPFAR